MKTCEMCRFIGAGGQVTFVGAKASRHVTYRCNFHGIRVTKDTPERTRCFVFKGEERRTLKRRKDDR